MRSWLHQFDTSLSRHIQVWPEWLSPCMKAASFLGQPYVTLGVVAVGCMFIGWMTGVAGWLYASATIFLTHGIGSLVKLIVGRPRPATYVPKRWRPKTHSFPSGHSFGSAAGYGTVALLLSQVGIGGSVVALFLGILIIVIGFSRVYLGAHYPTDVIAGWLLGAAGAFIAASFLSL